MVSKATEFEEEELQPGMLYLKLTSRPFHSYC